MVIVWQLLQHLHSAQNTSWLDLVNHRYPVAGMLYRLGDALLTQTGDGKTQGKNTEPPRSAVGDLLHYYHGEKHPIRVR